LFVFLREWAVSDIRQPIANASPLGTLVLSNIASNMWVKFKLPDVPAEDTVDLRYPPNSL